jgi:hypothetical protein
MNQELANVLTLYTTKSHRELNECLIGKSKDNLIGIFLDLLTMYINDKNSSTLREFITVALAGYTHKEGKIGYNGFLQDSFIPGKTQYCEAKPKNCDTNSKSIAKLRGAGNFSDYTFARLDKDKNEPGLKMLSSGFVDGRLIYIIECPFTHPDFIQNLENQLKKHFPRGKDISTQYLRSANFDYKNYMSSKKLRFVFILNKKELNAFKPYIVQDFYRFLEANAK